MTAEEIWGKIAVNNFWYAYQCLADRAKYEKIQVGVDLAIKTQIAIMDQAASIILSKKIQQLSQFRFIAIDQDALKDSHYFMFPQALTKLGLFMIECFKHAQRRNSDLPVVISIRTNDKSEDGSHRKYLIAGVNGNDRTFQYDLQ